MQGRGGQSRPVFTWRTHSCVPRSHSCERRSFSQLCVRRSANTARTSACATNAMLSIVGRLTSVLLFTLTALAQPQAASFLGKGNQFMQERLFQRAIDEFERA